MDIRLCWCELSKFYNLRDIQGFSPCFYPVGIKFYYEDFYLNMSFIANFVKTQNGKIPFYDFLDALSDDERIDIIASIDEIIEWKNNDLILPISKSRHLRNRIFEMRVRHKNIITRSLYFFDEGKRIIFTNGFIKKTQKTPIKEIKKAERLRQEYYQNKEHLHGKE